MTAEPREAPSIVLLIKLFYKMKKSISLPLIFLVLTGSAQELPPEYRALQKQREDQIHELNLKYVKALEKLKTKYTKKWDFKVVLKIDEEIRSYTSGEFGMLADVTSNHSKVVVRKGGRIFKNRKYTFLEFPDKFSGWKMDYLDGGKEKRKLTLNVAKRGLVYVICSKSDFEVSKGKGWRLEEECEREPLKGSDSVPVIVFKFFAEGQHVVGSESFLGARLLSQKDK